MTLSELKDSIKKYQYLEDDRVITFSVAAVIATRLRLGEPVWGIIIGASSGGKSQVLRPLALTDSKFLHRVDDLTENTFLSGMKAGKGKDETSLLLRIGSKGMLVISDLTVLFSKAKEARASILSQFRMIYDGEMLKYSGTSSEAIHWKGYLGVLAGATPSVYSSFEEVADMGERFIYWRLKDYDPRKATKLAMERSLFGKELDGMLAQSYGTYIKDVVSAWLERPAHEQLLTLPEHVRERIMEVSIFAERVRTTISLDFTRKDITRIPVPAMPMRVSLQLTAIGKALMVMRGGAWNDEDMGILDWCAYSLANEEKRAVLHILAGVEYGDAVSTQKIADIVGLSTSAVSNVLQNLSAVGVLIREGMGTGSLSWRIKGEDDWRLVRGIEGIAGKERHAERELTSEEDSEMQAVTDHALDMFGM